MANGARTRFAGGQPVEYTSFDSSGYSAARVLSYAPPGEQWQICPGCDEQAVPGEADGPLNCCPRCQAFVRFPHLPPLLDVQTGSGSRIRVRETQCRVPHAAERTQADA